MTVPNPLVKSKSFYEQDFYAWLETTANLLKKKQFESIDLENLIEEIEAMGRSEKREIKTRLITIIKHLLRLKYWQSTLDYNARGWRNTVIEQREKLIFVLEDSPSLRQELESFFLEGYQKTVQKIIQKYDLPSSMFPAESPFSLTNIIDSDYQF